MAVFGPIYVHYYDFISYIGDQLIWWLSDIIVQNIIPRNFQAAKAVLLLWSTCTDFRHGKLAITIANILSCGAGLLQPAPYLLGTQHEK